MFKKQLAQRGVLGDKWGRRQAIESEMILLQQFNVQEMR